jgi:hypothetical protein
VDSKDVELAAAESSTDDDLPLPQRALLIGKRRLAEAQLNRSLTEDEIRELKKLVGYH